MFRLATRITVPYLQVIESGAHLYVTLVLTVLCVELLLQLTGFVRRFALKLKQSIDRQTFICLCRIRAKAQNIHVTVILSLRAPLLTRVATMNEQVSTEVNLN